MIGIRLKEERERLGYTQPEFAEFAGAKKRTLIDWEKSVSSPTAVQLSALSEIGVDVMYVLTGQRNAPVQAETRISRREAAMLDNYRACDEEDQKAIERIALSASSPKVGLKKSG